MSVSIICILSSSFGEIKRLHIFITSVPHLFMQASLCPVVTCKLINPMQRPRYGFISLFDLFINLTLELTVTAKINGYNFKKCI